MDAVTVAVDCGGTSSKAVLVAGDDAVRFTSVATLSGYLEPARVGETLRRILTPIEARYAAARLTAPVVVRIGAAGYVPSRRAVFVEAARQVLADAFGGAVIEVSVANDALALLVGHDADGVVVAGTGSNVLIRDADSRVRQFGGHDWVAADDGSAFWLGLDGIRQVARAVDDGVGSPLVDAFAEEYRTDVPAAAFRDLAVAGPTMKADIAQFAPRVCAAAAAGDAAARVIVDRQVAALAELVQRGLAAAARSGCVRIVECGGMLSDETYRGAFEAALAVHRVDWVLVRDGLAALTSATEWDGPDVLVVRRGR